MTDSHSRFLIEVRITLPTIEGVWPVFTEAFRAYGLPLSIDSDIAAGRTVVCNVSRTVVAQTRERYANVAVVLVTAPPGVRAARLTQRARASDGGVADRMRRSVAGERELQPDFVIENVGTIEQGANKLMNIISGQELILGL